MSYHMIKKLRKKNTNICKSTFLTKYNKNTDANYNSHVCYWSLGLSWYFGIYNLPLLPVQDVLHPQQVLHQVLALFWEE